MNNCKHELVEELNRLNIYHGDNPIGTLVIAWCYACKLVIGNMQDSLPAKTGVSVVMKAWSL